MKVIKIAIVALLAGGLFYPSAGFASEATKRAAIEEMLTLTQVDKLIDPMLTQLEGMLESQYQQMDVTEEHRPIFEKYNARMINLMKDEMAWDKMKGDFIDLYMKVYTEDEIAEINRFYKSPVGQKMIAKMPELMQETMTMTQKNLQSLLPRIRKISEDMAAELKNTR